MQRVSFFRYSQRESSCDVIAFSFSTIRKFALQLRYSQHFRVQSLVTVLLVSSDPSLYIQVRWFTGWCVMCPRMQTASNSITSETAYSFHFSRYGIQVRSLSYGADSHVSTRAALQHGCELQASSAVLDRIRCYVYLRDHAGVYIPAPQWLQHILSGFTTCALQCAGRLHEPIWRCEQQ